MTTRLNGLCSMATRDLLSALTEVMCRLHGWVVTFESAGGVDVARRIRCGAEADVVVLDSGAMSGLEAEGLVMPGTLTPMFVSDVVAAVPADAAPVPLATEHDLRAALAGADRIAYSTGPSGVALMALFRRWGLADTVGSKLVEARAGTPVGSLLSGGEADLGFQQRSELTRIRGVRVLGPLPGSAAIRSTFSGAVLARSADARRSRDALRFLTSSDAAEYVRAAGMTSA